MEYQRLLSAGKINTEAQEQIKKLMQNTQRILQNIKIVNPYAPQLELPKDVFKPRRTNKHYIDFIEAVTFYHQHQREQQADESTGEIYIETTIEDIEEANKLMKEILLRKSDELSGACRNYFEDLKKYLEESKQSTFTNRITGQALRVAHSTIKRYHLELLTAGLIKLNQNKKTKTYWYEVTSTEEYKQLQNRISSVLDEVLAKIKEQQPNGSNRLTNRIEPVKPNSINGKKQRLTKNEKDNADQKNNEEPTNETE